MHPSLLLFLPLSLLTFRLFHYYPVGYRRAPTCYRQLAIFSCGKSNVAEKHRCVTFSSIIKSIRYARWRQTTDYSQLHKRLWTRQSTFTIVNNFDKRFSATWSTNFESFTKLFCPFVAKVFVSCADRNGKKNFDIVRSGYRMVHGKCNYRQVITRPKKDLIPSATRRSTKTSLKDDLGIQESRRY